MKKTNNKMRIVMTALLVETDEHKRQLVDGFKDLGFGVPVVVGTFKTLAGHGGDGGRSDVVIDVPSESVPKMAVHPMHLSGGFSWADDYWANNNDIVPEDAKKYFEGYTHYAEVETKTKKVKMTLVGLDGNAFCLMGAFSRNARKQGWKQPEIDKVLDEAKSGDYAHLVTTLNSYCDDGQEDTSEEE